MGIVLDSTVVIAAERAGKNPRQVIDDVATRLGDTEATLSVVTVIELAHGIQRANSDEGRITCERFLDELLKEISVEPITVPIALRAKGIRVALGDLLIGATALALGYAVAAANGRHFRMIPNLVMDQL